MVTVGEKVNDGAGGSMIRVRLLSKGGEKMALLSHSTAFA